MLVSNYVATRLPGGEKQITIFSEDGQVSTIACLNDLDFLTTCDLLRNEKPLYFRDNLLTTSQEPVGEEETDDDVFPFD